MALTYSTTPDIGSDASAFSLPVANPEVDEKGAGNRSLEDYADAEALVVAFICNHCPYVHHVEDAFVELARRYQERGVQFVAISANDAEQYPSDSFEAMAERAETHGYPFPYLYDASQDVAKAYGAACTPEFYVYDSGHKLTYHGRFDATRPGQGDATGEDLAAALDATLAGDAPVQPQHPAMGCNIKWRTA
jgi:peroxiredoxin